MHSLGATALLIIVAVVTVSRVRVVCFFLRRLSFHVVLCHGADFFASSSSLFSLLDCGCQYSCQGHPECCTGGMICGTGSQRDMCITPGPPCEYSWNEWSACDSTTGTQTRSATITRSPKEGGTPCPDPETRNCKVDCVFKWGDWSTCNAQTGKQSRSATITTNSHDGYDGTGTPCTLTNEERDCQIDCEFTWGPLTGNCANLNDIQTRSPIINAQPVNGGKACPTRQEHETCCIVNCVSTWNAWSACDQSTSKKTRSALVTKPASGGGIACKKFEPPILFNIIYLFF